MIVFIRLLFLSCCVPFLELWLLFQLADRTSPTFTLMLIITTGVIGAALARRQGFQVFQKLQSDAASGKMPTTAMADGAMILVAGALLLTPGILTDAFGFSLLIPPIRAIYRQILMRSLKGRLTVVTNQHFSGPTPNPPPPADEIIDVRVVDSSTSTDS